MRKSIWLLSLLAALAFAPAGQAAVVTAGGATVDAGDTFTIPISITGATGLSSFQFDLAFDPNILQVTATGVTQSDFFTQGDITVFVPGVLDNAAGDLLGVSDALIFQPLVDGDGVLVTIEFVAIAPGHSWLTLSNVFLNLSDAGFTVADGEVCVRATPVSDCSRSVPEPGSAALALFALFALAGLPGAGRIRRRGAFAEPGIRIKGAQP